MVTFSNKKAKKPKTDEILQKLVKFAIICETDIGKKKKTKVVIRVGNFLQINYNWPISILPKISICSPKRLFLQKWNLAESEFGEKMVIS